MPKFGEAVMGKVNSEGLKVLEWMERKLQSLKSDSKYWTSKHWDELWTEFKLTSPISSKLAPPPAGDKPPSDELLEKLAVIHSKNPADRSAVPLERYLDNLETQMSASEMYGVLAACGESPVVAKHLHDICFLAILSYIGRRTSSIAD